MRGLLVALTLSLTTPTHALTRAEVSSQPPCNALDEAAPTADAELAVRIVIARFACRLPADDVTVEAAEPALGGDRIAALRAGDVLTVVARAQSQRVSLYGALYGSMQRIGGSDLWVARFRLAELDRAMIMARLHSDDLESRSARLEWRGPDAPPAPTLKDSLAGQIVERTLWSESLQETRRLEIYLPPGHRVGRAYAAIFMADGDSVSGYARMIEPMIETGDIPAVVLVGAVSGQEGIVEDRSALNIDLRAADYIPDFPQGGDRFERHMRFFTEELVGYAVREFSVARSAHRRVVQGQSNGAVLAFWAALRRPDVFGAAVVSSQAGGPVADIEPTHRRAHFFMNAGLYEAPFYRTTQGTAETLQRHGYDVRLDLLAAGHMFDQTQEALRRFLPVALNVHTPARVRESIRTGAAVEEQ